MVKCTGRGLVVKQPGVLSKVQMLNLVLGVGVFSLLPSRGQRRMDAAQQAFALPIRPTFTPIEPRGSKH